MMIGQFCLAASTSSALFYTGLAGLIIGNGFFKPNISTMVGGLYRPGDARRDSAFTFFYMGINAGAWVAPYVCGTLGEKVGWGWGFASAGIGMGIGLTIFAIFGPRFLGNVGLAPQQSKAAATAPDEPFTTVHIHRIIVIFILALFVVFFWAGFEQAGGLMNLYTDSKVDRMVGGFEIPTSWFQSVNPFFIVTLGPVMSLLWGGLRKMKLEPSAPVKMAFGLFLLSLGFVLMLGASKQTDSGAKAALMWVVGAYFFHTVGELCLSPVGLSMVTKLAHQRIASLMMGVWFLANAAANKISGVVGQYSEKLGEYQLFLYIVIATALAGVVLLALAMPLKKMMHGAEDVAPAPEPSPASGSQPAAA
jgi:POT family proton-dependent oligopeptide transporter